MTGEERVRLEAEGGRIYVAESVPLAKQGSWGQFRGVEVRRSDDGGATWNLLPMRLSFGSRLRSGLVAYWPPERTRALREENGTLCLTYDNEWNPYERPMLGDRESRWIATYWPVRHLWTLRRIAYIDYDGAQDTPPG